MPAFGIKPGRSTHNNYVNFKNTAYYFDEMQESQKQQALLQRKLDSEIAEDG
jgi:hypothetical protein